MRLLELFCGTKSITKVFKARGWNTYTVDLEESMNPDLCIDVLDLTSEMILEKFGRPDVMWCSPPCTKFSVASIGRNWIKDGDNVIAKNSEAEEAKNIVIHTIKLIKELNPTY